MITIVKRALVQLVGYLHQLLDFTHNPINDARRVVYELEEQITKVEAVAAEVLAQEIRIAQRKKEAASRAEEFGKHAETAAAKGEMGLARKCLERQMEYEAQVAELEAELAHVAPRVNAIRERLEELRRSQSAAKRELTMLETRYALSKADSKASKLIKEVKGYDAGGNLAKAREAVANSEALAKAVHEINTSGQERLDEQVKALRSDDRPRELDERLARLTKTNEQAEPRLDRWRCGLALHRR